MNRRVANLVVTDLDGTLWDNSLRCHPRTLDAVRDMQGRTDTVLIAATGRRRNSAGRALGANGLTLPAVLLNGALGFDFTTDEPFHSMCFSNSELAQVLGVLGRHGVSPVAYLLDSRAIAVEGVTTSPHHLSTLEAELVWCSADELAERDDVLGMSMLGVAEAEVSDPIAELAQHEAAEVAGFSDLLYPPFSVMIAPPGVNKQCGIEAYCATRSLEPDRVIAVGDAGNDLSMLAAADVSVAVASAAVEIRSVADHEIGPPADGGWAELVDLL